MSSFLQCRNKLNMFNLFRLCRKKKFREKLVRHCCQRWLLSSSWQFLIFVYCFAVCRQCLELNVLESLNINLMPTRLKMMWCMSTRKLSERPSCPLAVAGALFQPVDAARDLPWESTLTATSALYTHVTCAEQFHAVSLQFAIYDIFVDTSPTTAFVLW